MGTYTLRLAINGEETDTTVENDTASWTTKAGRIRIQDGGGTWLRAGNQAQCQFQMSLPLSLAHLVRTITVGVEGPVTTAPPDHGTSAGGGRYYRVIFHGDVVSSKTALTGVGDTLIEFAAVSEMQGLMERRAKLAAQVNTGPRDCITDIETAHSLTIAGNTAWPAMTDFYQCDRPAQKQASNGEWMKKALAGTGCNPSAQWGGTITAPTMEWRTDYAWATASPYNQILMQRPWAYEYKDVGITWQDFNARITVNGETSAGVEHYGTCRLSSATVRTNLGNREAVIDTWIDSTTDCQTAAETLLGHIGEPTYLRMFKIRFDPNYLYAEADADPDFDPDPADTFYEVATAMVGDQATARDPFDDSNGLGGTNVSGVWPSTIAVNSDRYDDLAALWVPTVEDDGTTDTVLYHNIRSINREWDGLTWTMEFGLEPEANVAITGSSGTY